MDKEIQKQMLIVQLKILKELRILNQNHSADKNKLPILENWKLSDVHDAISLTGLIYI